MNKKNKLQKKILKEQQGTSKMIHKSKNRNKKKRKKVMNKSKQIKKNLIKMNMTINLLQKKSNLHKKKKKYRKNKILTKFYKEQNKLLEHMKIISQLMQLLIQLDKRQAKIIE